MAWAFPYSGICNSDSHGYCRAMPRKPTELQPEIARLWKSFSASSWNRVGDFGRFSRPVSFGQILLFDRRHPSAPTYTRDLPARAAAVKDGPSSGSPRQRRVLDGREHDGMIERVGGPVR